MCAHGCLGRGDHHFLVGSGEESFAPAGLLPLFKVRRGERLALALPLTACTEGTPMCACRSARLKKIAEARAHWVGSAYRSSRLGLALRFLRRLHGGACDRQEVSAKASEQPHTRPNRRRGLDDGPIGCGASGVVGAPGVCASGVAACPACPCSATKEDDLYSSFPLRRGIASSV